MSGEGAILRMAIEHLQRCKHLIGDDLVGAHDEVYDNLTLLLAKHMNAPTPSPMVGDDGHHPLLGTAERAELEEKYYQVVTSDHCTAMIYDVDAGVVVCAASEFFQVQGIEAFSWRGK